MKNFLLGILSFIYLTVASGVALNMHYCMGKLSAVEYVFHANENCDQCGMQNKKGCCHNDLKVVRLADDQQISPSGKAFHHALACVCPVFSHDNYKPVQGNGGLIIKPYYSPPDKLASASYLLHCVFRI